MVRIMLATVLSTFLLIHSSSTSETQKRHTFESFGLDENHLSISNPIEFESGEQYPPLQTWQGGANLIYASSIDKYLPIADLNPINYNLKVDLTNAGGYIPPSSPPQLTPHDYNEIKPVREQQEMIPQRNLGTAVVPPQPPPATPVNAVASNIPAARGAVFLGSGALGVVNLGNGAFALGSGSLGYSGNRLQPRPGASVPLYPPLPASPNLIPAAVPNPRALAGIPPNGNGYELLPPNRIRFGGPLARPPRVKITQQFATPTILVPNPPVVSLQPTAPGLHAIG